MKNEHYQKEFNKLFVEPIHTEMRAMNLNNEPCVMGSEKKVWAWIEQALKQTYEKGKTEGRVNTVKAFKALDELEKKIKEV